MAYKMADADLEHSLAIKQFGSSEDYFRFIKFERINN